MLGQGEGKILATPEIVAKIPDGHHVKSFASVVSFRPPTIL